MQVELVSGKTPKELELQEMPNSCRWEGRRLIRPRMLDRYQAGQTVPNLKWPKNRSLVKRLNERYPGTIDELKRGLWTVLKEPYEVLDDVYGAMGQLTSTVGCYLVTANDFVDDDEPWERRSFNRETAEHLAQQGNLEALEACALVANEALILRNVQLFGDASYGCTLTVSALNYQPAVPFREKLSALVETFLRQLADELTSKLGRL